MLTRISEIRLTRLDRISKILAKRPVFLKFEESAPGSVLAYRNIGV
jgi:hypothetical protein